MAAGLYQFLQLNSMLRSGTRAFWISKLWRCVRYTAMEVHQHVVFLLCTVNFCETFWWISEVWETHKSKTRRRVIFIFHNISISQRFPLDGFLFIFSLRDSELLLHATRWRSLQCVVQQNFNALTNVANAFGNIANAFGNNYSALDSVSNGLKYVATHFQCIFQRIFQCVFELSLMPGFRK